MRHVRRSIDAESFRGKLYLLVIDKLVIGALIAVALLVYDRWKTHELRLYTAAQEEAQRAFSRAEYVKQLVPIVLDGKADVLYRAHALAALVGTRSIEENSAMHFAQMLLDDGVLGDEALGFLGTRYNFLLATMRQTMPSGLSALLNEYKIHFPHNSTIRWDGSPGWLKRHNMGDAEFFWEQLFWDTIIRIRNDDELQLLNDDAFLVENIGAIGAMIPEYLKHDKADELAKRNVKALKIWGSIRLLQTDRSRPPDPYAVMQVESAIDPPNQTKPSLELAAQIMTELGDHPLCASIVDRPLEIILRRGDVALFQGIRGFHEIPIEDRFEAATHYLLSCRESVADKVEQKALPILETFYEQLRQTPVGTRLRLGYPESALLEHSDSLPIEHALIQILINLPDPQTAHPKSWQLISNLLSLPEDKLSQGGLRRFRVLERLR